MLCVSLMISMFGDDNEIVYIRCDLFEAQERNRLGTISEQNAV